MKHELTEEEVRWVEWQARRSLQRATAKVREALHTTRTPHERLLVCQHALQWASRILDAAAFLQAIQTEAEAHATLAAAPDVGAMEAMRLPSVLGHRMAFGASAPRKGLA